ncbi:hypothetical protein DFH07DRAFT_783390 [Mycena maculata]|uniref:Uncharacterized protein n=1 Tax=Mycena maculata TaxID=230809 RepID=A0AAD7HNE0_9AGAR|nr:hypothetical protein DFH07DRAFT_783390 [Mycena maculata]
MKISTEAEAAAVEQRLRKMLLEFNIDPDATFAILIQTRSFISGSIGTAVLATVRFKPNDVDVYCPVEHETTMVNFVEQVLGFTPEKSRDDAYPEYGVLHRIYWYRKGKANLNLMIVQGEDAALAVFHFHLTIVMNIVCGNGVYCAYPEMMEERVGVLNSSVINGRVRVSRTKNCMYKYRGRGFTFQPWDPKTRCIIECELHQCQVDADCPGTTRSIHDEYGKFYPINREDSRLGNNKDNAENEAPMQNHSVEWRLGGPACLPDGAYQSRFARVA